LAADQLAEDDEIQGGRDRRGQQGLNPNAHKTQVSFSKIVCSAMAWVRAFAREPKLRITVGLLAKQVEKMPTILRSNDFTAL
jgi:hypothetical protein